MWCTSPPLLSHPGSSTARDAPMWIIPIMPRSVTADQKRSKSGCAIDFPSTGSVLICTMRLPSARVRVISAMAQSRLARSTSVANDRRSVCPSIASADHVFDAASASSARSGLRATMNCTYGSCPPFISENWKSMPISSRTSIRSVAVPRPVREQHVDDLLRDDRVGAVQTADHVAAPARGSSCEAARAARTPEPAVRRRRRPRAPRDGSRLGARPSCRPATRAASRRSRRRVAAPRRARESGSPASRTAP